MVPGGSQPQIYQIKPLDFFSLAPSFQRYLRVKFRPTAPSSDHFDQSISFIKWLEKGAKFLELLRCKLTGGPKSRHFRKHLASLHQKIKKWPKTWGVFSKLLRRIVLNDLKVPFS